jgi:hypothetical protein
LVTREVALPVVISFFVVLVINEVYVVTIVTTYVPDLITVAVTGMVAVSFESPNVVVIVAVDVVVLLVVVVDLLVFTDVNVEKALTLNSSGLIVRLGDPGGVDEEPGPFGSFGGDVGAINGFG